MMKILLLTRYDRLGASSRLRFLQYLPYLEKNGIEVTVEPFLSNAYLKSLYQHKTPDKWDIALSYLKRFIHLFRAGEFNLVWMEKEIFPWMPAIAEKVLKHFHIPYVVDYDDAVFLNYENHSHPWVKSFLGNKITDVMKTANTVVVGNDYLAEKARESGQSAVEVIPTVIDLDHYPLMSSVQNDVPIVGWIGSPATAKYLQVVAEPLKKQIASKQIRFVAVGITDEDLPNIPAEFRPWTEETEVENIHTFDVGIMPLTDDPWTQGKCGYKLIQYMACRKPVIASSVGINKNIVINDENGYLADTPEAWENAFNKLIADKKHRETMGAKGRQRIEKEFCTTVTAPKLLNIFLNATK